MKINPTREFTRSSSSVFISVLTHVVIIVTLALLFVPGSARQSVSLTMESMNDDYQPSFESMAVENSLEEEMMDSEVFEASEIEEIEMAEDLFEESFIASEATDLSFLNQEAVAEPAAKQTQSENNKPGFFGIKPTGNKVVFVIDNSISMGYRDRYSTRFDIASRQLLDSIEQLEDDQEFLVICFCFRTSHMRNTRTAQNRELEFLDPNQKNKTVVKNWLGRLRLGSGTDPREALVEALKTNPSCVFLLSDGEFNGRQNNNPPFRNGRTAVELAAELNQYGCPIHTIGLHDKGNQRDMEAIANNSGGVYRFIRGSD